MGSKVFDTYPSLQILEWGLSIAKQVRPEYEGKTSEDFPGKGHPQTTAAKSLFFVVLRSAATPGTPSNRNHPVKPTVTSITDAPEEAATQS